MTILISFFVGVLAGIFFTSLLAVNCNYAEGTEQIDLTEEGDENEAN